MVLDLGSTLIVAGAAFAAGLVNAIAGGGSLITFPALVAVGLPPVAANVTNTVALCPGYLGAALAQRRDLAGQRARVIRVLPAGAIGGAAGAVLLLATGEKAFGIAVPYLILFAALLLAAQDRLRRWLVGRGEHGDTTSWLTSIPVAIGAVYGGYFGAGLGVILLAVLGIAFSDSVTRLNALKQWISLLVNVIAAGVFLGSGFVDWPVAGIMFVGSLGGGALGGAVASRVPPKVLRWSVITLAVAVAIVYLVK